MKCKNHGDIEAVSRCVGCQEAFCKNCLVEMNGKKYCGDCKIMAVREKPIFEDVSKKILCIEAKISLIYALLGIFLLPFIMGPIAVYGAIDSRKDLREDPNLTGDGIATSALIIGIIVSILGVLIIIRLITIYIL